MWGLWGDIDYHDTGHRQTCLVLIVGIWRKWLWLHSHSGEKQGHNACLKKRSIKHVLLSIGTAECNNLLGNRLAEVTAATSTAIYLMSETQRCSGVQLHWHASVPGSRTVRKYISYENLEKKRFLKCGISPYDAIYKKKRFLYCCGNSP